MGAEAQWPCCGLMTETLLCLNIQQRTSGRERRRAFKKTIITSHLQNPSDTSKTLHSARVEITTAEQSATRWESICWY